MKYPGLKKEEREKFKVLISRCFLFIVLLLDQAKKEKRGIDVTQLNNKLNEYYPITRQGLNKILNKAEGVGWVDFNYTKHSSLQYFEKEKKARHKWVSLAKDKDLIGKELDEILLKIRKEEEKRFREIFRKKTSRILKKFIEPTSILGSSPQLLESLIRKKGRKNDMDRGMIEKYKWYVEITKRNREKHKMKT